MAKKINERDKNRIKQLLEDGHTQNKIAEFYDISQSNVSRIHREIRQLKLIKYGPKKEK